MWYLTAAELFFAYRHDTLNPKISNAGKEPGRVASPSSRLVAIGLWKNFFRGIDLLRGLAAVSIPIFH
jgi:hypothetical protein